LSGGASLPGRKWQGRRLLGGGVVEDLAPLRAGRVGSAKVQCEAGGGGVVCMVVWW